MLRTQVASLRAANESLRALLEDKDAKITELEAKLARLERLISRNSGNSSMPPSGDDQPGKTPPKQKPGRGAGKRKPGKQPGAPGAYLAWNDHPDRTENLFPEGNCACGTDLKDAADLGVVFSHQVSDLPEEVRAQTVQYDRHEAVCSCGRVHVAGAPPQAGGAAPGTVTYGVNFQAWCVFLMVMHHVPVERCADIIESMAGTRPSRRMGALAAGPRRRRGRGGEHDDPGADPAGPRDLRRRDTAARRPGSQGEEEVPPGRVHQPAHLLLPGRADPALVPGLRLQRPARHRRRPRPLPELRLLRRHQPPAVHPAPAA